MNPNEYTILFLDDASGQFELTSRVLRGAGYRVRLGDGGEEGLWQVKQRHVDLIITDVAMPRFPGLELIQTMCSDAETAHLPVIAVPSHTGELVAETWRGVPPTKRSKEPCALSSGGTIARSRPHAPKMNQANAPNGLPRHILPVSATSTPCSRVHRGQWAKQD